MRPGRGEQIGGRGGIADAQLGDHRGRSRQDRLLLFRLQRIDDQPVGVLIPEPQIVVGQVGHIAAQQELAGGLAFGVIEHSRDDAQRHQIRDAAVAQQRGDRCVQTTAPAGQPSLECTEQLRPANGSKRFEPSSDIRGSAPLQNGQGVDLNADVLNDAERVPGERGHGLVPVRTPPGAGM